MSRLAFLALGGACLLQGAASAANEQGVAKSASEDQAPRVWGLLLPRSDGTNPKPSAVAAQIVRLGPGAVEPLLAILYGDSAEPAVAYQVDPRVIANRQQILMESLRRMPPNDVVVAVENRMRPQVSVDQRVLAVRVLALAGTGDALEHVFSIAAGLDPIQWQSAYVDSQIESSIVDIVTQDTHTIRRLAAVLSRVDPGLAPILVHALGNARVLTASRVLASCLGRSTALDSCILKQLAKSGERDPLAPGSSELAQLRSALDSRDVSVKRSAAAALAALGDDTSCPAILAMLESKDAETVSVAGRSLQALSGLSFGTGVKAWNAWYERESAWFDNEFPRVTACLASGDGDAALECARQLLSHKLYRHRSALALRAVLTSSDTNLQRKACAAFGMLGSALAAPWLLVELDDDDEIVRNEAWASLRKLTGLDLPLDSVRWSAFVKP